MITGMEIRTQLFARSIRGYNEEEVKKFLEMVAREHEDLYSENANLKESLQKYQFELEKYRNIEETMNNSLILAQQTAENLKAGAQREAERMLADSKRSIAQMLVAYQEIVKQLNLFNLELKTQLNLNMELLDRNIKRNEELSGYFHKPEITELLSNLGRLNLGAGE
jgi:cell division initiation protein